MAKSEIGKSTMLPWNDGSAGAANAITVIHAGTAGSLVVPHGTPLLDADFVRQGSDLLLVGPDGTLDFSLIRLGPSGMVLSKNLYSIAAKQIVQDNMTVAVGGGLESVSLVQNDKMNMFRAADPWLREHRPDLYMSMLETAEIVADRYNVSRDAQDEYAYQSQMRTAAAQEAGRFDDEIVPMTTIQAVKNKETGEISEQEVTLSQDEGNRPETTLEGLKSLKPV